MLLSEFANRPQFYVTFFHTLASHKPKLVGNVGMFADIKSAEHACREYFIQNVITGMTNSIKHAYDQGEMNQDEYQEMLEIIELDMDDVEQWDFGEYVNHRGQPMWDMGSGEYVFAGKYGSYPIEADITT